MLVPHIVAGFFVTFDMSLDQFAAVCSSFFTLDSGDVCLDARRGGLRLRICHGAPRAVPDRLLDETVRLPTYGPTHRLGTVSRVNRCGDATALDG